MPKNQPNNTVEALPLLNIPFDHNNLSVSTSLASLTVNPTMTDGNNAQISPRKPPPR